MRLRRGDDAGRGEKATLAMCAYACVNTCSVYAFFFNDVSGLCGELGGFSEAARGHDDERGGEVRSHAFP